MAQIFNAKDWLKNHPNRNNFDLTHKVHGSYSFGKLYPFLCKPVVPGDSFRIDTAISARFMPMPFPTQSNMRFTFHYFYVRAKNIWSNFENWIEGLEEHTPPYINQISDFYNDGSLADYLDIPTSYFTPAISTTSHLSGRVSTYSYNIVGTTFWMDNRFMPSWNINAFINANRTGRPTFSFNNFLYDYRVNDGGDLVAVPYYLYSVDFAQYLGSSVPRQIELTGLTAQVDFAPTVQTPYLAYLAKDDDTVLGLYQYLPSSENNKYTLSSEIVKLQGSGDCRIVLLLCVKPSSEVEIADYTTVVYPFVFTKVNAFPIVKPSVSKSVANGATNPYYGVGNTGINTVKVSALPFRAYESICRAFYRNTQGVQPFVINGTPVYNRYNTELGDGADSTSYDFFYHNWELDAYTSCLISPQQGNVPYIGITDVSALGRMEIQTANGDTATIQLKDLGDGEQGVAYENLRGDTPEARSFALRAASSGFTIPEFREGNALQRFLEMNIRKGYRYLDFIEGHFGVKPRYNELDMPEFLGGFTQRVSVNDISNTNGVDTDSLGAIAGQARAIGGSKHGISHYFDDFGFVVGIMCLIPDNAYDCILPKHYNLKNPLDMYFPEFNNLSMQAITHEELAPIQTVNTSGSNLTDVFGYQRPNHDLVWYPDTVHGEFRNPNNGLGNSVICRRFGSTPLLASSFLEIKPHDTDTIFNYTLADNDICLGEIVVQISAKRPVPRLVVPNI